MKSIYTFLFFLCANICYSQEALESALFETDSGAIIMFRNQDLAFTLDLHADSIETTDQDHFVILDQRIIQFFTLPFDNPKNQDLTIEENAKTSLSKYISYELEYFKTELNLEVEPILYWKKKGNMYYYFWYFDTPQYESLTGQMYLTTIVKNYFLNINSPLQVNENFEDSADKLIEIMESAKIYNDGMTFEEMYDNINTITH